MDLEKFKGLLESEHTWPGPYTFKFIVPQSELAALSQIFPPDAVPQLRPSAKGNYTAATYVLQMSGSAEVLAIYHRASSIKGLISL